VVFAGLTHSHALVANEAGKLVEVSLAELERMWTGQALVPWKNTLGLTIPTPYMINAEQRALLVQLLVSAGALQKGLSAVHETLVRDTLRLFQQQQGLEIDGTADERTLMLLYRRSADFRAPILEKAEKVMP